MLNRRLLILRTESRNMPERGLNIFKSVVLLTIPVLFAFLWSSCQKEPIDNNPDLTLTFSQDTIFFDTVFTSLGSTTQSFTVHNPSKDKIKISSIRLAGGEASFYRLNVDGQPALVVQDVEI